MKTKYISPLFQVVSTQPQEFCADNISNTQTTNGIFGGNADSLRDEDYE